MLIQSGTEITKGPYTNATIISVSKNGWCCCKWDSGVEFKVRSHWICQDEDYTIVPTN